jgi:hypothetical protein
MIRIPGAIQIGRLNSGPIRIVIEDTRAGVRVVEFTMSLEDFARAVTAQSVSDLDIEFNDSGLVGKKREHRVAIVPLGDLPSWPDRKKWSKQYLADWLTSEGLDAQGWKGFADDLLNHHNIDHKANTARVGLTRWVDAESGEVA